MGEVGGSTGSTKQSKAQTRYGFEGTLLSQVGKLSTKPSYNIQISYKLGYSTLLPSIYVWFYQTYLMLSALSMYEHVRKLWRKTSFITLSISFDYKILLTLGLLWAFMQRLGLEYRPPYAQHHLRCYMHFKLYEE